ncbi:hypothetical protein KY312_00835 [Candidatus Woesearchaeota archaeon]|nr:hypothetical protein [Candidatus Woesearchaeota archaeon]
MKTLDEIDKENIPFILENVEDEVLAIYRTGASLHGINSEGINYLVITDSENHSPARNVLRRTLISQNLPMEYVIFTKKDLQSPGTLSYEGKVAYLINKKQREKIKVYGDEVFDDLFDFSKVPWSARKKEIPKVCNYCTINAYE